MGFSLLKRMEFERVLFRSRVMNVSFFEYARRRMVFGCAYIIYSTYTYTYACIYVNTIKLQFAVVYKGMLTERRSEHAFCQKMGKLSF